MRGIRALTLALLLAVPAFAAVPGLSPDGTCTDACVDHLLEARHDVVDAPAATATIREYTFPALVPHPDHNGYDATQGTYVITATRPEMEIPKFVTSARTRIHRFVLAMPEPGVALGLFGVVGMPLGGHGVRKLWEILGSRIPSRASSRP